MFTFIFGFLFAMFVRWFREKIFPNSMSALMVIRKAQRQRQRQIAERAAEYIRMGFDPFSAGGIARQEIMRVAESDMSLLITEGLTNARLEDKNERWDLTGV